MIRINLLPKEKRPDLTNTTKILIIVFVVLCTVYFLFLAMYVYQGWYLSKEIKDVNLLSDMLKETKNKIEQIESIKKNVNDRVNVIEDLSKNKINKYNLLLHINVNLPDGVWVEKIANEMLDASSIKEANGDMENLNFAGEGGAVAEKIKKAQDKNKENVVLKNKKQEARNLCIYGVAQTFILVSTAAEQLKKDPIFKKVEILSVAEGKGGLKEFVIKCYY